MKNKVYLGLQGKRGFTLIELMITIGVLAIIATMAIPSFMTQIRTNQLYSDMREMVEGAMETRSEAVFRRENKKISFPETETETETDTETTETFYKTWAPSHAQLSGTVAPLEYNLLGFLVGDAQCIEISHSADSSITLAITFNKNGSVLSGKDKTSCS